MFSSLSQNSSTEEDTSNKIEVFKHKFSGKSTEELERIAADADHKPEAVEAARILLQARK